jgi:hypothetical protein
MAYCDPALAPVADGDTETLELFTHNEGARSAVQHSRRIKEITTSKVPASEPTTRRRSGL